MRVRMQEHVRNEGSRRFKSAPLRQRVTGRADTDLSPAYLGQAGIIAGPSLRRPDQVLRRDNQRALASTIVFKNKHLQFKDGLIVCRSQNLMSCWTRLA
jgi:hypothetical protein